MRVLVIWCWLVWLVETIGVIGEMEFDGELDSDVDKGM